MDYAKVVTRKEKRKPSIIFTEDQENYIIENVKNRNIEIESNKPPVSTNLNEKCISLEEKNIRVTNELDRMARTLGIRVGRIGMIEATKAKLTEMIRKKLKH